MKIFTLIMVLILFANGFLIVVLNHDDKQIEAALYNWAIKPMMIFLGGVLMILCGALFGFFIRWVNTP